jgi:peptide/nickel transport system substrate-binding protein
MIRKTQFIIFFMVLLCLLASGCGSQKTSQNDWDGTITISLRADPPRLDPCYSAAVVDRFVFQGLFDKLVDLDSTGKIVPMLAERWDISPDGLVYTLHLRHDVKFHDGTDFNADAVVFNINEGRKKESNRKSELTFVSDVKALNDDTVQITLKKPFSPFLSVLTDRAGMIRSPEAVKKYGADFARHPVGTGPFVFVDRLKGDSITLEKNPNYWGKGDMAPKAQRIIYKIIEDPNIALVNLKSGQIDFADYLPFNQIESYKTDPVFTVSDEPTLGFSGFYLNIKKDTFADTRVRKAIELLIDRDAIVKVALSGVATPGRTAYAPMSFAWTDFDKPHKPDIARARQLLKEAGKDQGLSFSICTDTNPINGTLVQMLQKMMRDGGIDMQIEKYDFGTLLAKGKKGNFDALMISWSGRIDPDQNIYTWLYSDSSNNYCKYNNPEFDQILDEARVSLDMDKRKSLYSQASEILNRDIPYVFLYHAHNLYGMRRDVKGYVPSPDGMVKPVSMYKSTD